ncbi:MAG: hypothetical protein QOI10_1138 [Solirubrobacterales bacterium]|jgi:plastocyanin|nr:hypothetical protein [Solirubrobacterales bacterium]
MSVGAMAIAIGVAGSPGAAADDMPSGHHPPGDGAMPPEEPYSPLDPILQRSDQYLPKPPGTKEDLHFWYGPYVVPPGWDANRVDLQLPVENGMVTQIEPGMRRVSDGSEPSHQEAHIHHAHWFSLHPGSQTDNYTYGFTDWMFGNGDEETKANFDQRSAADPHGPIYGGHIGPEEPQPMIYMLHNKTSQPLVVYIVLDVTFIHGTMDQLNALGGRPYHDVTGVLFGRTFDVPRDPKSKDGTFETAEDDPKGVIQWTSTVDGTMIGTGSHVHPGGLGMTVENYGSEEHPCTDDGQGYGGTLLLDSHVIWHHGVKFSEDYQTEVTNPAWRAPIHKGDRIRISSRYANRNTAWYEAMAHEGTYIDLAQPPKGHCKPYLVGPAAKLKGKKRVDVTAGVPNRAWSMHMTDQICGRRYDAPPCERPLADQPQGPPAPGNTVTISDFQYRPGDRSLAGTDGLPPTVPQGTSLTFVNADQQLNIRHSVTTCHWPCNGPYVANYPHPDGTWDSQTLGYDVISGGSPNPVAKTPPDLKPGKYAYFCRIHPWMRGAFEVVPN